MIIGLTGTRGVGKSTIANILVEKFGFVKAHAFEPGKAMCIGYYTHLGVPQALAEALVNDADYKDKFFEDIYIEELGCFVSELVPGKNSRYIMEHLGYFMGDSEGPFGPDYTLGAQLNKLLIAGAEKIVVESIVYEAPQLRDLSGKIVRIVRSSVESNIVGARTDEAVAAIEEDYTFDNNSDLDVLHHKVQVMLGMIRRMDYE